MRYLLLIAVACQTVQAQSIVVSGGRQSIVISGRSASVSTEQDANESEPAVSIFREVKQKQASAEPSPPPVVRPIDQPQKPILQVWTIPNCGPCNQFKAALSRGELYGFAIQWMTSPSPSGSYPYFRTAGKSWSGWLNGQASSMLQAAGLDRLSARSQKVNKSVSPRPALSRLPVVNTQWGTIDLETYSRNCNCPMCQGIRALQQQYRAGQYRPISYVPPPQEPTPDLVLDDMVILLNLTENDILADLGCGDGRILIAAAQRYGCRGIGIEIDPAMADRARQKVREAGLSNRITIITGDALQFAPASHGVTAITAYLYPDLLEKLAPIIAQSRIAITPFHKVPGLPMERRGDLWIHENP